MENSKTNAIIIISTLLLFVIGLVGCGKKVVVNSNVNQNVNTNINQNQNIVNNQDKIQQRKWIIEYANGIKKFTNNYFGVTFSIHDEKNLFKDDQGSPYYLAVHRGRDARNSIDYVFIVLRELYVDSYYNRENFEDYLEGYIGIGGAWYGSGAEKPSNEIIEQMIERAEISYRKITNTNRDDLLMYEVFLAGVDISGEKYDGKQLLIYYPDKLNLNKENKIFYIKIIFPDVIEDKEIYNQIISTFEFIKD